MDRENMSNNNTNEMETYSLIYLLPCLTDG